MQSKEEAEQSLHAREEIDRLQILLDQIVQKRGEIDQEIITIAKKLTTCEETFRQEGGDLYEMRAELEAERDNLEKELAAEETALRELAAGPAPFLLIPGLLEDTEKQARHETEARRSAVLVAALEDRDANVLKLLKRSKVHARELDLIERLLLSDRNKRAGTVAEPMILNGGDHLATELRHLRTTVLADIRLIHRILPEDYQLPTGTPHPLRTRISPCSNRGCHCICPT